MEYREVEMRRRDGGRVHTVANIIGRFDERGELVLVRGYLFDETRRRVLEQQLIQSQKMESLGTLAGGIAHDFNNILGIVLGYVALMKDQNTLAPDRIEAIEKATKRGTSLVRQLLMFARKTDVLYESINVNDTINEITKLLNETFPKTIALRLDLSENLPSIIGDVSQVHQVLLNLCINARDAMPDGGTLSLATSLTSGEDLRGNNPAATSPLYVQIVVSDSGIGMDESTQRKIFEPFFTTKGPGKGTGLGLSIVFSVVESHKGFINVQSQAGKGTSLHLFFPVPHRELKTESPESRSLSDSPGGTETVLVVEDEAMLTEIVKTILSSKGYTVFTAVDGIEAIKMFQQHHDEIDLVITDMGLPQMRGERVVRSLREVDPTIKVIVASGYLDPDLKAEISSAGDIAYLNKPYVPDELLTLTREVLDGKNKT
jgi:signal transduction histidine kinase/ActR/RegA family two-component response regulator